MNKRGPVWILVFVLTITLVGTFGEARAQGTSDPMLLRGAMLYDRWFAVLGIDAPAENQPLWATQSTHTASGADTWRCVTCHGWDYQGQDGAYHSGSATFTGFPGLFTAAQEKSEADLITSLTLPDHDFSEFLSQEDLAALARFIKTGLVKDSDFIDPITRKASGGDSAHGKALFSAQCAACHGEQGASLAMRFEGQEASLGLIALQDPWRFLHKTRFGAPGAEMTIGYELGWSAQDGRDVLLYAQGLPTGLEPAAPPPSMSDKQPGLALSPGGPARNIFSGIFTAFGAMAVSLGFSVLLGAVLVGIIFLVVWLIKGRKP